MAIIVPPPASGGDSLNGVTVTNTPTADEVLTATSTTEAAWEASTGGTIPLLRR